MLVKDLPRMVAYLKARGTYVLFNTNGTVLSEKNGRALIEAGLDELRVSIDAATRDSYLRVRGKDYFTSRGSCATSALSASCRTARASRLPGSRAGLTGLKETLHELPAFVRVAAEAGLREVYLQRLVFFEQESIGLARPDQALYESMDRTEAAILAEAEAEAARLGMTFSASGAATEPGMSLRRQDDDTPWSLAAGPGT